MDEFSTLLQEIQFAERFRGYDPDEVDAYVHTVAKAAAQMQGRLHELHARVDAAEARRPATGGGESEETLARALVLAQRTADATVAEAENEAARIVAAAEARTGAALADAEERAAKMLSSAQSQAASLMSDADAAASTRLRDAQDRAARLLAEAESDRRRLLAEAEREATAAAAIERDRILAEVTELQSRRDRLGHEIDGLDRHVAEQRAHLQRALAALRSLIEDPANFGLSDLPPTSGARGPESWSVAEPEPYRGDLAQATAASPTAPAEVIDVTTPGPDHAVGPTVGEPEVDVVESEVVEPEIDLVEPEVAEPEIDAVEPVVHEPEVAEPEVDAVEPEVAEPEVDAVEPVVHEPEVDVVEPEVVEPEIDLVEPEVAEPEIDLVEPDIDLVSEPPVDAEIVPDADEPPRSQASGTVDTEVKPAPPRFLTAADLERERESAETSDSRDDEQPIPGAPPVDPDPQAYAAPPGHEAGRSQLIDFEEIDRGPITEPVPVVEPEHPSLFAPDDTTTDDVFLAQLRQAVASDDQPLSEDDDALSAFFEGEDDDRQRGWFGRKR